VTSHRLAFSPPRTAAYAWASFDGCQVTSEQSTVHPDGWVGDPAELERARRYRAAIKWGIGPYWLLLITYCVVIFAVDAPVLQGLILLVVVFWAVLNVYMHRRVSQIIGRKWSYRLEQKERQRQDDPWQQRDDEANPVGDWLGAPVRPGTGGLEPKSREATAEGSDGVSRADSTADDALATQPDEDASIAASLADSHVPAAYRSSDRVAKPSRARNAIWMAAALLGMFAVVGLVLVTVLSSASTTLVEDLAVGDCFDHPESAEVSVIDTVSCEEAHDLETFAVVTYPTGPEEVFPGDTAVAEYGASACANQFSEFVGVSWFEAGFDVNLFLPNEETWGSSDRTVQCNLTRLDGQKAEGSARNAGRIAPEELVSFSRLQEDVCFDDTEWLAFGLPVSCRGPHDNEVYAVLTNPDEAGADYPSADQVGSSIARCARQFAMRADPLLAADLNYGPLTFPLPFTWALGHRTYVCALWDRDLTKLSESQLSAHQRFNALIGDEFQDQTLRVSFPDFASVNQLGLVGSAQQADNVLSLTTFAEHARRGAPFESERPQRGAAWSSEKVPVENGFETAFVFQLEIYSWFTIGDGLAFVIQDSGPAALGEGESGMGYKGIPNSVAIEFDPLRHGYESDPGTSVAGAPGLLSNHVSVQTLGIQPNISHASASVGWADLGEVLLADRAAHVVLIRYVPGEMTVFVDDFETPALRVDIDLGETLQLNNGSAHVGFTASSGPRITGHKILGWEFASTALPSSSPPADVTIDTEPADVTINVEFDVGSDGVFTADPSGPICPAGSMKDEPGSGEPSGQQVILQAVNVFTCEDGSGTFTLKLFVILYPDFTTTFDWIVTDGTGDYTGLQGQGSGVGTPIDFPLKSGVFTGEMHID
jgi:hypothetical protein